MQLGFRRWKAEGRPIRWEIRGCNVPCLSAGLTSIIGTTILALGKFAYLYILARENIAIHPNENALGNFKKKELRFPWQNNETLITLRRLSGRSRSLLAFRIGTRVETQRLDHFMVRLMWRISCQYPSELYSYTIVRIYFIQKYNFYIIFSLRFERTRNSDNSKGTFFTTRLWYNLSLTRSVIRLTI